jgi:hypothetical protein
MAKKKKKKAWGVKTSRGLIIDILCGLIPGAGTKISHNIYIWDRAGGTLVKVLEGPKDSLDDCDVSLDCTVHYIRPPSYNWDVSCAVELEQTYHRFSHFRWNGEHLADYG